MQVSVITFDNKAAGNIELPDALFGIQVIRRDILARVVNWQLAKRQAGTHKTKGISDISGTTRKPFRQKGTGNARQGSLRSPQYRGGATIFGPVVRSHAFSLPKKIRKLGMKMALSDKAANNQLIVIDAMPTDIVKTRDMAAKLKALGIENGLFVVEQGNDAAHKAIANIPNCDVLPVIGANVHSILKRTHLVITRQAAQELQERLA